MPTHVRLVLMLGVVGAGLVLLLLIGRVTGRFQSYRVPSSGMAPTLKPGDMIFAEGLSYLRRDPALGEVVVFSTEGIKMVESMGISNGPTIYIQRVAGLPGDSFRLDNGTLLINDKVAVELEGRRYVDARDFFAQEVIVPEGHYLLLGDNSPNSLDSRYWGFLPRDNIKSRYFCHYWRSAAR